MIDAVDLGHAFGSEAGDDERGGSAKVAGHDRRAAQGFAALDDGARAFDGNVGAEPREFADVHETGFEDAFGDDADAGRDGHERHHLGLGIGRITGIGQGGDVDGFQTAVATNFERTVVAFDFDAALDEFVDDGVKMIDARAFDGDFAVGGSGGDGEGGGFDAVGNDFVFRTVQFFDAGDGQRRAADAVDFRAHGDEEIGEVSDFGFARGAFDDGDAFGEGSSHEDVGGAENGRAAAAAHENGVAMEFARGGDNVAVFDFDVCAEGFDAFEMEINGARADDATAGQRDLGFAETTEERAENTNRAAHFADEIVVANAFDFFGADFEGVIMEGNFRAERFEDFAHEPHVAQVGDVADDARLVCQKSRGHDGERGVFCATDGDFAV